MSNARKIYFDALGVAAPIKSELSNKGGAYSIGSRNAERQREARRAALDRAHDIRKFEIELYWKRATYFWLLQAAVFTAFGLILREENPETWGLVPVALSCLGLLTALSGWLSSLGSKFWQSNWEHHIDMLEDEFEGRLHKTAWVGSIGARWSVSGVNERLGFFFMFFWIFTIWFVLQKVLQSGIVWGFFWSDRDPIRTMLFILVAGTISGAIWSIMRISALRGEIENIQSEPMPDKIQSFPHLVSCSTKIRLLKRADIR